MGEKESESICAAEFVKEIGKQQLFSAMWIAIDLE